MFPVEARQAWAALACLLCLTGCPAPGDTRAQPPPLFPQGAPPALEPVQIESFDLPRSALTQTQILDPRVRAALQVDDFKQSPALVDVLWVVSNDGIMADERDRLSSAVSAFIQVLADSKVNWQMGVTSTDLSSYLLPDGTTHQGDGGLLHGPVPILTAADPTYLQDFQAALTWPIQRDSAPSETSLFRSMQLAVENAQPGGPNAGLIRDGAALAVIGASNTDDQSFGEPAWYARWLKGLKGKGNEQLLTFSALGGPAAGCIPTGQAQIFGADVAPTVRLSELVTATGGVFESICDEPAFVPALQRIALNLKTLRRYFPLSVTPDPTSLSVTVNGQPVAEDPQAGWEYLSAINTIAFLGSYVPDPGADVTISYAVGS
ncbi:MAG: vWA domain-containing protein [Deltaproteobacteria bacterium]